MIFLLITAIMMTATVALTAAGWRQSCRTCAPTRREHRQAVARWRAQHPGRITVSTMNAETAARTGCLHRDAVPVTLALTGKRAAWLCPRCDEQLPASWQPPDRRGGVAGETPQQIRAAGFEPIECPALGMPTRWVRGRRLPPSTLPPAVHDVVAAIEGIKIAAVYYRAAGTPLPRLPAALHPKPYRYAAIRDHTGGPDNLPAGSAGPAAHPQPENGSADDRPR